MLNHLDYQGRMVADPELKTTNSGGYILNFRVAWSEKYKEKETKCFLECKAFAATAEFISKYFRKGDPIVVEGKLNTEEWENQNGDKRSKIVLIVNGVHFCGKKEGGESGSAPAAAVPAEPAEVQPNLTPVEVDELPF